MLTSSLAARNRSVEERVARLNSGFIRLYAGEIPASPDVPVSTEMLAELRFSAVAFGAAVGGSASANAIDPCLSARSSGVAGFVRLLESDGSTPVMDGDVGVIGSGAFVEMNTTAIMEGGAVSIQGMIIGVTASNG